MLAESIVSEERQKEHHFVADQLSSVISQSGSKVDNTKNHSQSLASNDSAGSVVWRKTAEAKLSDIVLPYGFDKHEIRSKTVAASFYEEIYEIAPRSEEYYIHTITSVSLRVNGEEYDLEWEPSEVRCIIADFFSLES